MNIAPYAGQGPAAACMGDGPCELIARGPKSTLHAGGIRSQVNITPRSPPVSAIQDYPYFVFGKSQRYRLMLLHELLL